MRFLNKFFTACLFSVFFLTGNYATSQIPIYNEEEVLKLAGDAKAIVLNRSEKVRISFNKGKPLIYVTYVEHILFLNEGSAAGQEFEIPYSDKFFPLKYISANTFIKTDNGYKKIGTKPATHTSKVKDGLFYDDMKQATVVLPAVEKYSITELKYEHQVLDPMFVFPFYFKPITTLPLVKSIFRIEYDEGFDIKLKLFGDTTALVKSSDTKGKVKWTEMVMKNSRSGKEYDNEPGSAYFKPHIFYLIQSYSDKSSKTEILGTTDQLYKQNYSYIKNLNDEVCSKELSAVADSIKKTVDIKDSLQIIEDILYWIQGHIRYIAIEDGLSGYVPRPSNAVFDRRYGDCKDMASLMQYMLKACKIQSNLAWIGTRDIPYSYADLPINSSSNHMILAKKMQGKWHFYDPTAEGLKSDLPSSFIQGKEAMISIDENNYEIIKVPEIDKSINYRRDSVQAKMSVDGGLELKGKLSFGGLYRWRIVSFYTSLNDQKKKELVESLIKHNYDKAKVINYEISNLTDNNAPFQISYNIIMPDFANKIDKEFYFNPHFRKPIMNEKISNERKNIPVEYSYKNTEIFHLKMELPNNYKASSLPLNVNYNSELIRFDRIFSESGNHFEMNSILEVNTLFLKDNDFEQWNRGVGAINKSFKESIVVKPQ